MIPKNCTKKKHQYRLHEPLSNGQWLNLFITKSSEYPDVLPVQWKIAVCISKTVRQANDWNEGARNNGLDFKQTGKVGLEGLIKALNYINEFGTYLRKDEILWIDGVEGKRANVYRRLLKYPGWQSFDSDGKTVFMYSNPKYWRVFEGGRKEI